MSTTTSHAELIGHSTTQQPSAATVDGGPNIIIMENNIINCGGDSSSNKYIITSQPSSQQQQTQPQHIILSNSGGIPKKSGKIAASQNNRHKSQSLVVSSKSGQHQMIMTTNAPPPNMVTQSPKMYTVQQKTPKTMYTTQQVYTTNVVSSSSPQPVSQQKTMRNVQVVSKNANNMILCRSPSSNNHTEHAQFIQQIHESNQQQQQQPPTTTTTMKTIYVNNNTGGLNLNKSSNNNKILTPIDYSAVVEQQQKQQQQVAGNIAKYVTQKIVQNSNNNASSTSSSSNTGPELIDASSAASSSSTTSKKNFPNNCTISVPTTTQYYYQPATVYTTDPNKVSSSTTTTTKIIAKNVQQQQPQYIQIQNHRLTGNNTNYVTTTNNPAPIQKHRNSTSSNSSKYIIQNVQSNAIPVSSVTQQSQSIRQTTPTVISYSNSSTTNNSNEQQPSVIQSPLKMRTVLHPIEASGIEDGARIYTVHHGGETTTDEVDSGTRDQNYMMVNGTKMTDEMSARILHDLSQRSNIKYNSGKSNHTGGGPSASNGDIVQLSQGTSNVYATRQPDGTVIWNGTPQTPTSQETQYVRRTSESSNYVPAEYQRQSSNSISGSDSHIIYQSSGIIVDRAQAEQDEEVIGIEVRPSPIPITPDGKLSVLHAVYQDHTYCTPTTTRLVSMAEQTFSTMNPNLDTNTVAAAAVLSSMPGAAKLFNRQSSGVVTSVPCVQQQQSLMIPMQQQTRDDDANSTISTESHGGLYIDHGEDPGEETETALEGEGEEDSETRCICELTHDDGYMICCDSCSTWQHVDCMKIDRQNIPEEYQCVNCFPREVDTLAARTLQLQKRKEQSALQLYPIASIYEGAQNKMQTGAGGKNDKKNNLSLKQQKKKDLLSGKKTKKDLKDTKNNKRNDSANRSNGKRKDPKRLSKKKLKQLSGDHSSSHSTPDKLTSTLRNWIDNYEVAMTNHYSPELRARLQSYGKQMTPADLANLPPEPKIQWMDVDQPICTTVPHAGAKILISTRNIDPNAAIIEIRGKYMLDTQQNKSNNAMLNATRKPSSGPFLFYHSIPRGNLDICVDTRTYGNEARFIRRSCRPNAEIQHKMEKNSVHLYIVARYKIMEGAEITIAHDVNVDPLTRTNSMSHTSTLCACGLVRDCKFAAALAATPPLSSPPHHSAPPLFTQNVIKRKNGVHVGPDGVKEKRKYKKRKEKPPKDQKENRSRGRSTSSSTDSHAGMLSPPLKNYDMHPDFIRSQMIPQSHLQILPNHITEQAGMDGVRSMTPVMQQQHHEVFYESSGLLKQQLDAPHHEPSIDIHHVHQHHQHILPKSPPAIISDVIQVVKEVPMHLPEPRAITPVQLAPIVTTSQHQQATILHSPVPQLVNNVVPVSSQNNANKQEVIQKSPPTTPQKPQKRSSKSQRNSMHETSNSVKEEASSSTMPNTPTKDDFPNDKSASHEKKKLTREERKLEAYIKAFEKIEKKEQRKQEQKTHKITPKKNRSLNSSSSSAQKNNLINANKRRMMNQKRKKRKSKSQSGKKGDHHSDSSDASSCDEKITKPTALNFNSSFSNSRSAMSSAELLLSYSKLKNEAPTNLSGIPPLISPACMLVEAAVGDLEPTNSVDNSFKFPHKTKTKKGMMNEWLNNSENDLDMTSNNIRYGDEEPLSLVKNEFGLKNLTTPPQSNSPQAESCSFAGSESAVKKRWLRQAISEETNDESGNSQQNEFTTPLKKRRVVIEQQAEEASPSSSNDVTVSTKIEEGSQESLSENVKEEEEIEENLVKKEETETKSNLLTLEDVKIEEETVESLKKEENTVETLTNNIKVEEPEDEKSSNSDEMAHLHKVVASFHSESLLMLQSRNKKTSGTASLPETPKKESKQGSPVMSSDENVSKSVSPDTTMQEPTSTVESPDAKNVVSSTSILAQTLSGNAPTTPVAETIPFGSSRYLNNIQRSEVPSILATAPPVIEEYTPTADYRTSFTYRPMMTNLTMNMSEYGSNESTGHPQDPYIPSYNKATLIAATTPTGATLTGQFAPSFSSTYPSSTNDVSGSNTGFLGKSYSTLNDTTTGPAYYGQKIFTKTASHDPRLNPSLVTTPEEVKPAQPPQPKKKLSLTEYRKRKAQSTDSASNDGENSSGVNNISTTDDLNASKTDEDFPNKRKFTPNASPTRNSFDEDTTRSGNVTPTPCNNIDDTTENDNLPSSSTSGNNSPTRSADDELTEKVASKMTSNVNDTGNSPTQTTENEEKIEVSSETNNDNAVTQDVDEDKK